MRACKSGLLLAACGLLPAAAAGLKSAPQASQLCTEEPRPPEPGGALETCAQGFERGVPCRTLYRTHSCCTHCDPNHDLNRTPTRTLALARHALRPMRLRRPLVQPRSDEPLALAAVRVRAGQP